MSSSRFNGLNIALLAITVLSLMFGVYGFVVGGLGNDQGHTNSQVNVGPVDAEFEPVEDTGHQPLSDSDVREQKTRRNVDESDTHPPSHPDSNPTPRDAGLTVVAKSQPSDHGDAVIQGSVIGPSGAAVAEATVIARRSDLDIKPPTFGEDLEGYRRDVARFLEKTAQESRSTVTDAQGKFRFSGLDPLLAYDLSAHSDDMGSGDQDRVAAGDTVVLLLASESMLHGRVETADGKPVSSFSVKIWRENRQWEAQSQSFEDKEGKFAMPSKNGEMLVEVTATGLTQGQPAKAEAGLDAEELVIVLDQAAILSGIVTDNDGNPLGEVDIRVGAEDNNRRNRWNRQDSGLHARTDSKGRYRFDTLPPKETKFTAELGEMSKVETITLSKGENTLNFSLDVGAIVRLRLSDPEGKPMEPDNVWFQKKDSEDWPRPERMPAKEPGLAEYAGLEPGQYTLTINGAGYPMIREDVEVVAGANEFKYSFSNGATLTGTIVSSSGSKVSNVTVRLRKEDEQGWGGWGGGTYAQIQEDGGYKLGPAEPGQWHIEVYSTGGSWTKVYTDIVTLTVGENQRDITVDAGATVVIKLQDDQGNAMSWGNVQLVGDQGGKSYSGRSESDGTVTISFVQVGSYSLVANARGKAAPSQFVSLRAGNNSFTVRMQEPNCCRLTYIYPDTQASKAGLKVGDIVTEYNGQAVNGWGALGRLIRQTKSDQDVTMLVDRGGTLLTLNIKGGTLGVEGADGVR